MDAKTQLINYANELKTRSNTVSDKSEMYILNTAAQPGGLCFDRQGNSKTICTITRSNGTMTITETKISQTIAIENGKVVFGEKSEVINTLVINL